MKKIFDKEYSAESLNDLEDDILWAIEEEHNIPVDEHNFLKGTFHVVIEWSEE